MCLAMPGKIVKIEGDIATIDYLGQKRQAKIIEGDYKPGDYVFVSAQIIVQKLDKDEALKSIKAWGEAIQNAT